MPAGAPWWAWLLLGLAGLLVPAVVQVVLARRRAISTAKLAKDVASLVKDVAELKARPDEVPEETDPTITASRERQLHKLETVIEHVVRDVTEIKATMSRRAEEDAQVDRKLERELGRVAGLLEAHNVGSSRPARRG